MDQSFLENQIVAQLLTTFSHLFGIRMFSTVFTTAYRWSLSYFRLISPLPPIQFKIYFNIFLPSTHRPFKQSLLFGFPNRNFLFFTAIVRATCLANCIFLDLTDLIVFSEKYKLWSPHYTIFSALFSPYSFLVNIFSFDPVFRHCVSVLNLLCETKFNSCTKQGVKLQFLYVTHHFCRQQKRRQINLKGMTI